MTKLKIDLSEELVKQEAKWLLKWSDMTLKLNSLSNADRLHAEVCGRLAETFLLGGGVSSGEPTHQTIAQMEKNHIRRVLSETETLDEASQILGINSSTLWRKRNQYRLD